VVADEHGKRHRMVASTEVGRTKLALRAQRLSLKSSSDIARRLYRQYCPVCPAGSNLEMLKNVHMLTLGEFRKFSEK
jgi:hypothetical protein